MAGLTCSSCQHYKPPTVKREVTTCPATERRLKWWHIRKTKIGEEIFTTISRSGQDTCTLVPEWLRVEANHYCSKHKEIDMSV